MSADGNTLAVGAVSEDSSTNGVNGDETDNSAIDSGAVYVFTRDNSGVWIQQAYIKASNTDTIDRFGSSLALSGDGVTLAVGAWGEGSIATGINGDQTDTSANAAGAVYVYTRDNGGVWTQQAYVKASNTDASGDFFGFDVALSTDGDTLAVGAVFEDSAATGVNGNQTDNSAFNAGAAYVFTRDGGGVWAQQAYVKASNTDSDDAFASSLALSGDGDTLAVSSVTEDSSATGVNGNQTDNSANAAGAVYVYTRDTGGVWTQQAYVKASNTDSDDGFASGLALSGDGDTLAVGSGNEDSSATGVNGDQMDNSANAAGAVYVYTRNTGDVWTQQAYVKASNTGADDLFGVDVAVSTDGDTLAVAATLEDGPAGEINTGAVYVFIRGSGGVWTQQAYVKASNTGSDDWFGQSVTLSGDGGTLAMGSPNEDSSAAGVNGDQTDNSDTDAGAAYVLR